MDELIERLREEADGYGHGPTMFTNGEIAELRSLLREAAAALEAAREDGWQPIETAPRDGSLFLGCMDHSYHPQEACWAAYHPNAKGKECWRTAPICGNKIEGLTHWRPLPAPPAIDQARGKENGNG